MDTSTAGVYNDFSGLSDLRLQARVAPEQAAKEVAQQFESIFVTMMLESMRNTLPKDGLFGSDQMEAYQEMLDQQMALDMSKSGGLGLAQIIERQIAASSTFTSSGGVGQ